MKYLVILNRSGKSWFESDILEMKEDSEKYLFTFSDGSSKIYSKSYYKVLERP